MKIVLICSEYPPRPHGGIGTFVQTLARALDQRNHSVTVVGLGATPDTSMDGRIRVVTLGGNKTRVIGNVISRWRLRKWLVEQANAGEVDVIEVPDYLGLLPFGVPNVATVVRLHLTVTSVYMHAGGRVPKGIRFYEGRTLAANPNWIAVSNHILNSTKQIFRLSPAGAVVIHNPVAPAPPELPHVADLPAEFVLYAGQLSRRKGALALAKAARTFLAARPDLHLVYVGGPFEESGHPPILEEIRTAVGADLFPRVKFLGHVPREVVLACMRRARVYVFPSSLEALGLVVLEAMSCGVAVVCTQEPPGPEMVEDEVNGLLTDPNSPADISSKVSRLLDDRDLAARLASNAQASVQERFSLERCVTETEGFYQLCRNSSLPGLNTAAGLVEAHPDSQGPADLSLPAGSR